MWKNKFLFFHPPSLWHFVLAVLENGYSCLSKFSIPAPYAVETSILVLCPWEILTQILKGTRMKRNVYWSITFIGRKQLVCLPWRINHAGLLWGSGREAEEPDLDVAAWIQLQNVAQSKKMTFIQIRNICAQNDDIFPKNILPKIHVKCIWMVAYKESEVWELGKYRRRKRHGFDPWVGKIPWRRARQPTPVFLPGECPWTEEPVPWQEDYTGL